MELRGGTRGGRYRLGGVLGVGGMAAVYLASDRVLELTARPRSRRLGRTPPRRPGLGCAGLAGGQGGDQGRRMDAVAFQALVDAADGADNLAGYCKDATTGNADAHGQGQASPPSVPAPATSVSPPSSGPPADPGPSALGRPTGQVRSTGRRSNHSARPVQQ